MSGLFIIGIGEAFLMLHSLPAMEECLRGVYPEDKLSEVSNAMGSLISGANGAGSFTGIIIGSLIFSLCTTKYCLESPSQDF
jgi:hypothetical protein